MNVAIWLQEAVRKLEHAGIATARLDAEVLLADELGVDRSWLHAHPDHPLTRIILVSVEGKIGRRVGHEPLAYIRGRQEFYGREFAVTPDTLTPRPETETMIELLKNQLALELPSLDRSKPNSRTTPQELQVVDVGTGSGCIIVTAALELSNIEHHPSADGLSISYTGLDISQKALRVARVNADTLGVNVAFKQFDLKNNELSAVLKPRVPAIIVANLPYVPNDFRINLAASHEPPFAIYGGEDGLDYYRLLFQQISKLKNTHKPPSVRQIAADTQSVTTVITESLPTQHDTLRAIALEHGFTQIERQDFIQVFNK